MAKKEINQKHQAANFEAIKLITKGYQKMLYFLEGIPSTSFYSDFGDEAHLKKIGSEGRNPKSQPRRRFVCQTLTLPSVRV